MKQSFSLSLISEREPDVDAVGQDGNSNACGR
jgi:hypothetical protein